jgi:hypothetical protein
MKGVTRDASNERSYEVKHQQPRPGPEYEVLEVILGKWINEGHTVETANTPSAKILTSDLYEWSTGGFFVLHTAYGRVGDAPGGGIEIIGLDPASGNFISRFFDSRGDATAHELTIEGDTWTWLGEKTRCMAVFTDGGRTPGRRGRALPHQAGRGSRGPSPRCDGRRSGRTSRPWRTLAYDAAYMDGTQLGRYLPAGRWDSVTVPTLVVDGGTSPEYMHSGAQAITDLLPDARRSTLEGQTHEVDPEVLAPVLAWFFAARDRG